MKSKIILIRLLIAGSSFLLFSNNIVAQEAANENSFYKKALGNTQKVYHQSFDDQSALYNGRKYAEYPFLFKEGYPFFYSSYPSIGTIRYDGVLYDSILISYDETKDVVVINDQGKKIQLFSKKVEQFSIFNNDFIRLEKDTNSNELISSGFYNLLYKGDLILLKKQVKTVKEEITNAELIRSVNEKDYYYIKKDQAIFSIKSSKDLYRLLGDKKKQVQQFVKENNLKFSNDKQNMLTKATAYFDSLKK